MIDFNEHKFKTVILNIHDDAKHLYNDHYQMRVRISAVNDNTITVRDTENKPRLIRKEDVERLTRCNQDTHIAHMAITIDNIYNK